ncbi:MAG: UvrD-helicase domain-containing protein [Bacilli bacterium]|nr:UvrD-helicase domain-containing protein [Bacilli bacterium]
MTKWTEEQLSAIFTTGSNIIVSAGAGSGKTAVLTERVIEKLKSGININNLIVLTFTNAAAFEMKSRIKDSIKKIPELKEQLNLIDSSYITTFDSFALSLVRKYHYLISLPKDISIIDNVLLSIKKKELLDSIFERAYTDEKFKSFIDTFTTKDDDKIKETIELFNEKLNSISNKSKYLNEYLDKHYNSSFIEEQFQNYLKLLENNKNEIISIIGKLNDTATDEIIIEFVNKIKESLSFIFKAKVYEDYIEIANYKTPTFPSSKKIEESNIDEIKKYFSKLKTRVTSLQELTDYSNKDEIIDEIIQTKEYIEVIVKLIINYDKKILEYKRSIESFEFNDIMRFCIEILEKNLNIANEIKTNTNEIMVDEFQDTNDIGEYFLSLISNNNLYMVGDVKQSIYKFRNANPKIFTNTYYSYKEGNGICIDLNRNFRSREEVLDNINLIFNYIMDTLVGGVEYDEKQALICGNKTFPKVKDSNMELLSYEYKKTELSKVYTKDELEIFIIADDILKKMQEMEVFDKETKQLRKPVYSDFAILLDRKSSFDTYKQIFEYKGIPLTIHKDETFSYTDEMYALKNLFKLINIFKTKDFKELKYSFMSVGRSFILEYSDKLLYENIDNIFECKEFKSFIEKINYLAQYSNNNSLSNLVNETYKTFDIYMKLIKISNVLEKSIKLDYLVDVSKNLEQIGYTLQDFVLYFDEIFNIKTDISFSLSKDTTKNAVNIMTIHKSKGLEFPICYFASLYKEFNIRDVNGSFLFDNNIGLISPIFKEGIKDTIYKPLVKNSYLLEDISERIRVLYVALTRAKEKIVFVSNFEDYDEYPTVHDKVDLLDRMEYKSFLDILLSIKNILKKYIKKVEPNPNKKYEIAKNIQYDSLLNKTEITFEYINTDNKKQELEEKTYSNKPSTIVSANNMEDGIEIHEILEYLDFNNYKEELNNYQITDFIKEKIIALFSQPFMKNINKSKIYKEYPINNGKGIIDLLIIGEKCIVVDYKTKNIDKEEYINQVRNYMEYMKNITNLEVEGYIYSIIEERYIEVK